MSTGEAARSDSRASFLMSVVIVVCCIKCIYLLYIESYVMAIGKQCDIMEE